MKTGVIDRFSKSIIVATLLATSWTTTAQVAECQEASVSLVSNDSTTTIIKEMLTEFDSKQIAETTIDEEQGIVTLTTIYGETIKLNASERRPNPLWTILQQQTTTMPSLASLSVSL